MMNSNAPNTANMAGMPLADTDPKVAQAIGSPQVYRDAPMDAPSPSNGVYSPGMESAPAPQQVPQADTQPPIRALLESTNIAETLDEDKLNTIGQQCKRGFDSDCESR
jgi:hypothetical protein